MKTLKLMLVVSITLATFGLAEAAPSYNFDRHQRDWRRHEKFERHHARWERRHHRYERFRRHDHHRPPVRHGYGQPYHRY